ncbi:DegV family protein [Tissierella creatinini]|nr:DegV family protein [Tissierella creatinini]TJX62485.1 DegV family protein [Soehngenia saccharolytica]
MGVKILTDTGCDLPVEIIKEYDIDILPIIVIKDNAEYLDQVTISSKEVYDGMRAGDVFSTAQISAQSFTEKFEEYSKKDQSVLYLAFSSGLSGTYQTSVVVKETIKEKYPRLDLDIIDTKAASLGFGLIVLSAAKMAKEGKTKEEIIEEVNKQIDSLQSIFTVDDLEYLFRGGRVSKTTAFVGGLLNIKPVLKVNKEGKLVPIEKVRGRNKVFKRMIEIMRESNEGIDYSTSLVAISHGDDLEGAMKLKDMVKEEFNPKEFLINTIGAGIGSHSGPGTIALFFFQR